VPLEFEENRGEPSAAGFQLSASKQQPKPAASPFFRRRLLKVNVMAAKNFQKMWTRRND